MGGLGSGLWSSVSSPISGELSSPHAGRVTPLPPLRCTTYSRAAASADTVSADEANQTLRLFLFSANHGLVMTKDPELPQSRDKAPYKVLSLTRAGRWTRTQLSRSWTLLRDVGTVFGQAQLVQRPTRDPWRVAYCIDTSVPECDSALR